MCAKSDTNRKEGKHTAADPITSYNDGITITEIGSTGDWPVIYGMVITYKYSNKIIQYVSNYQGYLFFRTAGTTGNEWNDWKDVTNYFDKTTMIYNNVRNNGYNANTDRTNLASRLAVIKYVIDTRLINSQTYGYINTVVRYANGYYYHYYITKSSNSECVFLEIIPYDTGSISLGIYNANTGSCTILKTFK